jgi:NAD(P)-dependent dehydrogenase (short-subunit alcohol dehydrogenase family)
MPVCSANERTAVITGANRERGIGLALVRELPTQGVDRVVGTFREPAASEALLALARADARVVAVPLDVTNDSSVEAFGRTCADLLPRLDLVVNNAGVGVTHAPATSASIPELEVAVQTHAIGMVRVTQSLLPLLGAGSVVLNISSSLGSLRGMGRGSTWYGPAKALQNALMRQLAPPLLEPGIVCFSVCPGWVATDMGRGARRSPAEAARDLLALAEGARPADAGTYRNYDGTHLSW